MKREKINSLNERDLLIGLITSDRFCREIVPVLSPKHLEIEYARILAEWIKDYFDDYGVAPQKDIMKLYRARAEELRDDSLQENVLSFIRNLDEHYDEKKISNVDFAVSQSVQYLKKRSLNDLAETISANIALDDVEKAESVLTKYKCVESSETSGISLLHDSESIADSFLNENTLLFEVGGAFGKVLGKIHREDFVAFLAPMKRGKSWALLNMAVESLKNGLKVVFVSLEMSQEEMTKRAWSSLSGQLSEDKEDIDYPYFVENSDTAKPWKIEYKKISRKAVSIADIGRKQKNMIRMFRGGDIRIISAPAYGWSVERVDAEIEKLSQKDGYNPDVIIIDYADILAPSEKGEYRNQLDGIWKRLRGLAQRRKAVVFTATQSTREGLSSDVGATSIAEDIRKLAHVTCMVALNQNKIEKEQKVMRLSQLAIREGSPETKDALCLQCYDIGRFCLDSKFADEVEYKRKEETDSDDDSEKRKRNKYDKF
jgi:replicative DNA helicase